MTRQFNWLHVSDLHAGLDDQSYLWPRFQNQLLDDLKRLATRAGPWHCVIFSGDLVQSGRPEEFDRVTQIVSQVWEQLKQLGMKPLLVTIPGNHDLSRPSPDDAAFTAALRGYGENPDVARDLWADKGGYRAFIEKRFEHYSSWRERMVAAGVHAPPLHTGIMPGDASYRIDGENCSATIVGLNSTWLQLTGDNFFGRLEVHPRQLMPIVDNRPDEFLRSGDVSLIVSHHPVNWMLGQAIKQWNNEIDPPGRFDAHLFGHMHVPSLSSHAFGGSPERREVQAASLFGLEYVDGNKERIQGYSACRIDVGDRQRALVCWPRRLIPVGGDVLKLAADQTFDLTEDNQLSRSYAAERTGLSQGAASESSPPLAVTPRPVDLDAISHHLPEAPAHLKVREVEKQAVLTALREDRTVWISADWGMGEDGFLAAVRNEEQHLDATTVRFNFEEYRTRELFLESVKADFGWSFQQICDALPKHRTAYLIFDEIPVPGPELSGQTIDVDIEALAKIVVDYAPTARIILRSRRSPLSAKRRAVHLGALEEPDVALYVRDSELGGERYSSKEIVQTLFRHTDGVPSRIDALLRQLEVGSLDDLLTSDTDISAGNAVTVAIPRALTASVSELKEAEDTSLSRTFDMLKALSSLPKGEQIARLKRFYGPDPLYPSHALELLDRALIDTISIAGIGDTDDPTLAKALIVPRPVREYVRGILSPAELHALDGRALELYFGEEWKSGDVLTSNIGKRTLHPLCNANEIANANILIARTLNRAIDNDNDFEIEAAIRLGTSYVAALIRGDHYRSAVALSDDILAFVGSDRHRQQMNVLRNERMGALRMSGEPAKAREAFQELDLSLFSKAQKQDALLTLALAQESLRDEAAVTTADEIIALGKGSAAALQADVIKAGAIKNVAERKKELERLLLISERRKRGVVSSNIKMQLSTLIKGENPVKSADLLKDVIKVSKVGQDYYNGARATINLAERRARGEKVDENTRRSLLEAYHFLYNERLSKLFDRCHRVLWDIFEDELDTVNLLNLFRHSSFIWRLNGEHQRETEYLGRLSGNFTIVTSNTRIDDRDRMYFIVRVTVVMGEAQRQLALATPLEPDAVA